MESLFTDQDFLYLYVFLCIYDGVLRNQVTVELILI